MCDVDVLVELVDQHHLLTVVAVEPLGPGVLDVDLGLELLVVFVSEVPHVVGLASARGAPVDLDRDVLAPLRLGVEVVDPHDVAPVFQCQCRRDLREVIFFVLLPSLIPVHFVVWVEELVAKLKPVLLGLNGRLVLVHVLVGSRRPGGLDVCGVVEVFFDLLEGLVAVKGDYQLLVLEVSLALLQLSFDVDHVGAAGLDAEVLFVFDAGLFVPLDGEHEVARDARACLGHLHM